MFVLNEDKSIYVTRGDVAFFSVTAEENGVTYMFQPGDVIRIKVMEKKACENVVLQKSVLVEAETDNVGIYLTEEDTRIGDVISKAVDYWYEIELNPYTNPQTIIGYDDDGAKIFKLFPEGSELEVVEKEDIPVVDEELSLTSERPVQNQAIARAINNVLTEFNKVKRETNYDNTQELLDLRIGYDGKKYESAGEAVRGQISKVSEDVETLNGSIVTEEYSGGWELGKIDGTSGELVSGYYYRVSDFISLPKNSIITVTELWESTRFEIHSYNIDTQEYIGKVDTLYSVGNTYTAPEDMLVRCMATVDATTRMDITTVKTGLSYKVELNTEKIEELEKKSKEYDAALGEKVVYESILSEHSYDECTLTKDISNYDRLKISYMIYGENDVINGEAEMQADYCVNISDFIPFRENASISAEMFSTFINFNDYAGKLEATVNRMTIGDNNTLKENVSGIFEFVDVYGIKY